MNKNSKQDFINQVWYDCLAVVITDIFLHNYEIRDTLCDCLQEHSATLKKEINTSESRGLMKVSHRE